METNLCTFPKIVDGQSECKNGEKCGLYFRNMYELIHHIEEEHIPLIEAKKAAEFKQLKEQFGTDPSLQDQYEKAYSTLLNQPVPLSLICKLRPFPKGHKVNPIQAPKQRTMKFCYYKPKTQPTTNDHVETGGSIISQPAGDSLEAISQPFVQMLPLSTTNKLAQVQHARQTASRDSVLLSTTPYIGQRQEEQPSSTTKTTPIEETPKRIYCEVEGCRKAYKNQQGLRNHMRNVHGISVDGSVALSPLHSSMAISSNSGSRLSATEESILSRQLPGRQSPFVMTSSQNVTTPGGSPSSETIGTILGTSSIRESGDSKYQCQFCARSYKILTYLNKHLSDAHNATIIASSPSSVHSSHYSSPIVTLGGSPHYQQLLGSQQSSPHRPIATSSNSVTIIPVSKGNTLQQQQQIIAGPLSTSTTFIAPTITTRHHHPTLIQHSAAAFSRPSAPVPPSTPPSPIVNQELTYSPQHQPNAAVHHYHHNQEQPQHYFITQQQQANSMDQQPPILQPQQQPTQRLHFTYNQPQTVHQQQRHQHQQQGMEQSIYPASGGACYNSGHEQTAGTATIFLTQHPHKQQQYGGDSGEAMQRKGTMEVDQQQQLARSTAYTRPYYRQQPTHYMVESAQSQQQSPQHHHPAQQQTGTNRQIRSITVTQAQQYNQPQIQTQQHNQPMYQHQSYGGRTLMFQQQPFVAVRTVQTPPMQRSLNHQHSQQYQQRQQRSSPAAVAAVLAGAASSAAEQYRTDQAPPNPSTDE